MLTLIGSALVTESAAKHLPPQRKIIAQPNKYIIWETNMENLKRNAPGDGVHPELALKFETSAQKDLLN